MAIPRLLLLFFTMAVLSGCAAYLPPSAVVKAVPPKIPVRDFFRNIDRGFFRISGDGQKVSFMQPAVGSDGQSRRMNIFVQSLRGTRPIGEPRQLTFESARDIFNYWWKGSDTLLYLKDIGGDENYHVMAVDTSTGIARDLTPHVGVRADIVDSLPDDPAHILVQHNRRSKQVFDLYRLNLVTGAETLVAANPGNIVGWLTDHAGAVRVGIATDGANNTVLYREREDQPFRSLLASNFRTKVNVQFFDAHNDKLYAISNRNRDKAALVRIDPASPDVETLIYAHPNVDVDRAVWSRARTKLVWAEFNDEKEGRQYFDAPTKAIFDRLEARLPHTTLRFQSANLNEDTYVVAASSDRSQGARYLFHAPSESLEVLGEIAPWLKPEHMARMNPVRYTARDGLEITGYLTLPVGRAPKNLPCVVNPHGGPWSRDRWGFNEDAQFLANRGLCVLQMNYRGSTGFGRRFWEAGFKQWGLAMQDDIADGVNWLVIQGIADPKRVAIYGGSYGGYATLAGITKTPELYAAAVNFVGISNLFTFLNTIPPYWEPLREQLYQMIGDPNSPADVRQMAATSPALNAAKIRTPLLVAQGARDPRVSKAESDQIVEALRRRGVAVEYIVKDNEGHGFANEENRLEFYEAMERFFSAHLQLQPRREAPAVNR